MCLNGDFWKAVCARKQPCLQISHNLLGVQTAWAHSPCSLPTLNTQVFQRMSSCEGTENPGKLSYWEILKDFSSGWKEFCTLAGNQCFPILIRPVTTPATDIPTPGRASFTVPIIAANAIPILGFLMQMRFPWSSLCLAASGCLMKGGFPCSDLLLTLNYINFEKTDLCLQSITVG